MFGLKRTTDAHAHSILCACVCVCVCVCVCACVCRHRDALTAALATKHAEVVASVLEELAARGGLDQVCALWHSALNPVK